MHALHVGKYDNNSGNNNGNNWRVDTGTVGSNKKNVSQQKEERIINLTLELHYTYVGKEHNNKGNSG